MEIQTEVLFKIDSLMRITEINEPTKLVAPFFFLGRTKEGNVIRFNKTYPEFDKAKILELVNNNQTNIELGKLIINVSKLKPISNIWMGPAYVFPKEFNMTSKAIKITNDNKDLLQTGFPNLIKEFEWRQPIYVIIQDGIAVSVCCSARKSTRGAEASVETLESYQGFGYATSSVIAWAIEVKKAGLQPLYSTAWDNFSSQAIAKKLNLYKYGVDLHIS
jgi:hypothetical protein